MSGGQAGKFAARRGERADSVEDQRMRSRMQASAVCAGERKKGRLLPRTHEVVASHNKVKLCRREGKFECFPTRVNKLLHVASHLPLQ